MWHLFKQRITAWLRLQLNNNPIVFNSANYFSKLGQAVQVWLLALVVLCAAVFIGCSIIVLGALNSWF